MQTLIKIFIISTILFSIANAQNSDSNNVSIGFNIYHQYRPQGQAPFNSIFGVLGIRYGYRFHLLNNQFLAAVGFEFANAYDFWFVVPDLTKRYRLTYLVLDGINPFYDRTGYSFNSVLGIRLSNVYSYSKKTVNYEKIETQKNYIGLLPDIGIRWHSKIAETGFEIVYSPIMFYMENGKLELQKSNMLMLCISN